MVNFASVLVRYPKESPRFEILVEQAATEESPQRRQFRRDVKEIGGEILSPFTEINNAPQIAQGVLNGIIPLQEVRDLVLIFKGLELMR